MTKYQITSNKQFPNKKLQTPNGLEVDNWLLSFVCTLVLVPCSLFRSIRALKSIRNLPAQAGFTLIEILVTAFLIGTLSLGGMIAYGTVRQQEELAGSVSQIAQLLNLARVRSIAGDNDSAWKVVLNPTVVYLQDNQNTTYEQYALPSSLILDPGTLTDVEFRRASGRVDACQAECILTLSITGTTKTHQLGILYSGVVEY